MSNSILLVEDNEDDIFVMERIFRKMDIPNPLKIATNGRAAIDYLKGAGEYANRVEHPLPGTIFLDLKLPYVDGFGVLTWIRSQPNLVTIPVIILTSSPETRDREMATELGAQLYMVKPPPPEIVLQIISSLNG